MNQHFYRKKVVVILDPLVVSYCGPDAVPYVRVSGGQLGFVSLVNPKVDPGTITDRVPMTGYKFSHIEQSADQHFLAVLECPANCQLA